eukprot:138288_1
MDQSQSMSAPDPLSPHQQKMNTITDIVIVSILSINYLILLPIFIQCVRIMYNNGKLQVFRSRRPVTLQYIVGITFVVFALIQPFRLFDGSISTISYKIPFHIPSFISNSIEYSITLALLLCYCQRAYLLHYDFNYHEAILNKEWKQFTSLHEKQLDWFLKHRNTAGNRTFTIVGSTILWLLLSVVLTTLAFYLNIEAHWIVIQLALFALMEVIILKLILSMPGVDVFRIRDEYTYLLAVGLVFVLIIATLLMLYDEEKPFGVIISRLIYHLTAMVGTVTMCAISVIYPYRVHYAIQEDCNKKERSRSKNNSTHAVPNKSPQTSPKLSPLGSKTLSEMLDMPPSRHSSRNNVNLSRVSLDELMKYLVGIEAFLDHLVKELSAENLFFLSDVWQYKSAFVTDGVLDEVFGWSMELPDDIPKSHILQEPDPYARCAMICNKYIRRNSEREINISWSTRNQIVKAFDAEDVVTKPEPITFCTRFDCAAEEIRKLLTDSYRRFCLTPQYKKFCRDYNTRTRRIQRKLSKSFRSVTRELSRDRSFDEHSRKSPHMTPMKRLKSSSHEPKLSDINEHMQRQENNRKEDGMVPLSPISLSIPQIPLMDDNILSIQTEMTPSPPALTPFEQDTDVQSDSPRTNMMNARNIPTTNPDTPVRDASAI